MSPAVVFVLLSRVLARVIETLRLLFFPGGQQLFLDPYSPLKCGTWDSGLLSSYSRVCPRVTIFVRVQSRFDILLPFLNSIEHFVPASLIRVLRSAKPHSR